MGISRPTSILSLCFTIIILIISAAAATPFDQTLNSGRGKRNVIDIKGGPEDVVWVVQLSDLHFSVHHPDRGVDFRKLVGPALSFINPSLVLITGDLTDGKSKDLLTMKQHEEEWIEYHMVMEDVVRSSGLSKSIFYDLRGNHDNFGVPEVGGAFDFFSGHSLNGQLGRSGIVNSVTLETSERKLLFLGFDSTMSVGLRGPTNLFGHPSDELISDINSQLSQWDSQTTKPLTKIAFGHFPLSFSASSFSGKTLKNVFFKHSISAYLCGHLHKRFGKNLKRHHELGHNPRRVQNLFQLNAHHSSLESVRNCSNGSETVKEFWEWEMGDWRKSRAMRILAIDRGFLSFLDSDFKMGDRKTFILPTFPLDSRFLPTKLLHQDKCLSMEASSYGGIRTLVFSSSTILLVIARIYDSSSGRPYLVLEASMSKLEGSKSRGDLYSVPWNFKAFEDSSPDRYLLQIEATDIMGRSTLSELRPFSLGGTRASLSWTWKEFFVMGCQWDNLYLPILWSFYFFMFTILLIPRLILALSEKRHMYRSVSAKKSLKIGLALSFAEFYKIPLLWQFELGYLIYLIVCPWIVGQIVTQGGGKGYMTYKGWVMKFSKIGKLDFLGFPDIMVVVLPHLFFVVLPAVLVTVTLAAESGMYQNYCLSLSGKKEDDLSYLGRNRRSNYFIKKRLTRNILLVLTLVIFWKHFRNCRALVKAYELNLFLPLPFYCFSIPLLLAYAVYKTRSPGARSVAD